ncbi:MAG: DEAD/DEAH box helicase [Chromatiaceae bacterium]
MERILYEDVVGHSVRPEGPRLSEIAIPTPLAAGLVAFFGADIRLSPPQVQALDAGVIRDSAHFLVSAPTNSGKTLIALLRVMAGALSDGARSVYVVPLKALAEEKAEEMARLVNLIAAAGGRRIRIRVSTGDYRLSGDFLGSPPPYAPEVLICTPERLEVILRHPDNLDWARSVATYVLDEFHLLGEEGRGAVMESLVTRLLMYVPESSILALSATIGGLEALASWLGHRGKSVCVLDSDYRYPPLRRMVVETDDKDAFVADRTARILAEDQSSLLIFVYRKADAEALAKALRSQVASPETVSHFHAGLPLAERRDVAKRFRGGEIRVLVATSSLKMGINTPATEVIVRDTVYFGAGRLRNADILQMMGRAGRGNIPGDGYVLCASTEGVPSYPDDLAHGRVEPIEPQLVRPAISGGRRQTENLVDQADPLCAVVLSELARRGEASMVDLRGFIEHSYSGWQMNPANIALDPQLASLDRSKLIYRVENAESTYGATKLGRTTVFSGLSPESGAMLGGFLRALIKLGQQGTDGQDGGPSYLRRLRELDFLFLSVASFEARHSLLRKPTKKDKIKAEEYVENLPTDEKPLINLWRSPTSADYPTRRLLSSLRFPVPTDEQSVEASFYRLLGTAILLHRHARGATLHVLVAEYGSHAGSLESGVKYTATWVLSCLAEICRSDRCYKLDFLAMRIYELLEDLSLGSTLGKLATIKGVGRTTVRRLMEAGYSDMNTLAKIDESAMTGLGVTPKRAASIARFLRRQAR